MNHKRGKPKSSRSGCMMCKPQKHQCVHKVNRMRWSDRVRFEITKDKMRED